MNLHSIPALIAAASICLVVRPAVAADAAGVIPRPAPTNATAPVGAHPSPPAPGLPAAAVTSPTAAVTSTPAVNAIGGSAVDSAADGSIQLYSHTEESLQRKMRLLELESKIADLQKKIASNSSGGDGGVAASKVAVALPPAPAASSSVTSVTLPAIPPTPTESLHAVSVLSLGTASVAELTEGGAHFAVHVGDKLTNGWIVVAISPTQVVLAKDKRRKTLRVGE